VRNRWYAPVIGRFLSEDPIGHARGENLYTFGANDPVNASDPSGTVQLSDRGAAWMCYLGFSCGATDPLAMPAGASSGSEMAEFQTQLAALLAAAGDFGNKLMSAAKRLGREAAVQAVLFVFTDGLGNEARAAARFTPDQNALIQLAKHAQKTGGATVEEMTILTEWANELNVLFRGPEAHPGRGFGSLLYFRVGPVNHIPLR
jgi:uncharacterized protein RhaS with RHS repeats